MNARPAIRISACALVASILAAGSSSAATVLAADLDYGISNRQSNTFGLDFSSQSVWTAGAQRSENGSADGGNQRAGRVFADLQLDAAIIAAAGLPGATASLTFMVDSIGVGVSGTPYLDGLDLRFLGSSATDRSAGTLWNTAGVGGDQSDILSTGGATGGHTIVLTNPSVLSVIAGASPGDYISFAMTNSSGVATDVPVGNSTAETYGFQMSTTPGNYALTIVPEPTSLSLLGLAGLAVLRRRRA